MASGEMGSRPDFSAGDWEQVKDLVFACQTTPPPDLDQWLRDHCPSPKIRAEVTRLLRASSDCGTFLGQSASEKHLGVRLHQPMRVGRYRVIDQIGSGGSGVVYAAWDESLNRKVAVKVLRPEVAQDAELQKRLRWDARAASALQHPNIVVVHEVGFDAGVDFVAMECISGQTLSQCIKTGGMEAREVLRLAIQICSGLEAAHATGIVHRDLKPGNIMVTDQGVVKILDFGLAKNCCNGPDFTDAPLTLEGHFAGTLAYVSPEQADARPVDARSDIFSFGSVLYEMLIGRQAFPGTSTVSVLADIMLTNPRPAHELAPDVAPGFEEIVSRCLRKDRDRRFQSIAEVKVRLRELEDRILHPETKIQPVPAPPRPARWPIPVLAASAMAIAALAAGGTYLFMGPKLPGEPTFTLTRITADRGVTGFPALSNDATLMAYASDRAGQGNLDIWVQHVKNNEPRQLTTDAADDYEPVFSPDGSRVLFRSDREGGGLYSVSVLGGAARLLAAGGHGARYSPDGKWIAYWTGEPGASLQPGSAKIYTISAVGGVVEEFQPRFQAAAYPIWSPSGDRILFKGRSADGSTLEWWTAPFHGAGSAHNTRLTQYWPKFHLNAVPAAEHLIPAAWLPDQTLVFAAEQVDATNIWATKTAADGTPTGQPWRLTAGTTNEWHPATAQSGGHSYLAYESRSADSDIWEVPLDGHGHPAGPPRALLTGFAAMGSSSLNANGSRLVFSSKQLFQTGRQTIRMEDLSSSNLQSVVAIVPSHNLTRPVLSGDGKTVAYWADKDGYVISASGGAARRICEHCGPPTHISYDGRSVLFEAASDPEQILLVAGASRPKPLVALNGPRFSMQTGGRFSPDNRWIVFSAGNPTSTGKQIFIAPLHPEKLVTLAELIPITAGDSADIEPYWSPDGKTIFFLSDRDGFRCIWARGVNDAAQPRGAVYEVAHFHRVGYYLGGADRYAGDIGLTAGPSFLAFSLTTSTSDIWLKTDSQPEH